MSRRGAAIGLTGGIGCGKSEAGRLFAEAGAEICDADDLARRVVEPGEPAYEAIVRRFGQEILTAEGRIDRKRLADLVFADASARRDLEAAIHPRVRSAMGAWRESVVLRGRDAVGIIPLLYEVGADADWDVVVCVRAPPGQVRERLRARGWTDAQMDARLAAQWPLDEKVKRADYVLDNGGTREQLAEAVRRVYATIRDREKELEENA